MSKKTNPEELPKQEVAKRVIAANRRYFVPSIGATVEARSAQEVVNKLKKKTQGKTQEEGDGK